MRFTTRLSCWIAGTSGVVVAAVCVTAYLVLTGMLYRNVDTFLWQRATEDAARLDIETGQLSLERTHAVAPDGSPADVFHVQVLDHFGKVVFRPGGPGMRGLPVSAGARGQALKGRVVFETGTFADGEPVRSILLPVSAATGVLYVLQESRSMASTQQVLRTFRAWLGWLFAGALALTAGAALALGRRALRPVETMRALAEEIGERNLDQRLYTQGHDELGRLASTLNRMLDRLQTAVERQKRLTADVAHDLRTPLTALKGEMEVALTHGAGPKRALRTLHSGLEEVNRLTRMVNDLMTLALADSGGVDIPIEHVSLNAFFDELRDLAEAMAEAKGIVFSQDLEDGLSTRGDENRLRQLFINLLDNAIKYTPPGARVCLQGRKVKGQVVVTVVDEGIGIAPEDLPHIFDRFYRADPARSGGGEGSGLGLAICKWICEAHGGCIQVQSRAGEGSRFTVTLPAA